MEKHPIIWGLDIGHSSVKAAKLSRNGNTVTVLAYAIEPIVVVEDGDRDEALVKALQQIAAQEDFGSTPVIASLSGRQIFSRTINIPVLNPKKVDKMVELEARQQIPGNFDEVEWGYHLSPAADGASNDVAIFAVKRDITEELIRKTKRAGINLVGVSVSSLALYNFVRFDQVFGSDETVIILDVGAENTDLVLYEGESLWMRTLAMSGNDITKAFMKKFRVSFEEAETLKRQVGDSRQAEKIMKVLEGALNELGSEVQRSLGFYKSQSPNAKLENIVISGNTFRLPGLPEYIAERLRYTVNILEDLDKIEVAAGIERDAFLKDLQSLGVALGLALQGVGVGKANVDLMPKTMQVERILKSKIWAAVALIVILAGTFVANYLLVSKVITENTDMTNRIKDKYQDNEKRVKDARDVLKQVGPLAAVMKSYDSYGAQKGVPHAVFESVIGVIEEFIKAKGLINAGTASPETGGEPQLQAIYLDSIDVPPFAFNKENGPFRPMAEVRKVKLKIRIPQNNDLKGLPQQIVDKLKALPVPDYLKSIHGGEHLFGIVQETTENKSEDVIYHVDNTRVDDKTGLFKKLEEERRIPVLAVTFDLEIGGPSALKSSETPAVAPAPAAPVAPAAGKPATGTQK